MATGMTRVAGLNRYNLAAFRRAPWAEISGSLGDLGTLLPLMIALAAQNSIRLDATLVFSGLFNILTGIFFGVPLPVQPMKAIASAAISAREDNSIEVVMAAGQIVGAAVLVMSLTGGLRRAVTIIPVPVVKGIQLGAGLSLIVGAGSSLLQPLTWFDPILDNRIWAMAAFIALISTQHSPRFPYALLFFAIALCAASVQISYSHQNMPWFHVWEPRTLVPEWIGQNGAPALWMAIGQLPLTSLNSIIAVNALAADILPEVPTPTVTIIGFSVAVMNLTGTWFGAMPVCHGAGGLAAQHRFGARSGASVIFLGLVKLLVGLFLGDSLEDLLKAYPKSLLGIMVFAAGLELAKVVHNLNKGAPDLWEDSADQANVSIDNIYPVVRRQRTLTEAERHERWTVMLTTTAGIMAFKNDALGLLAGMSCYLSYRVADRVHKWQAGRNEFPTERDALLR